MLVAQQLDQRLRKYFNEGAPDECWPWLGGINAQTGYGGFNLKGGPRGRTTTPAHRAVYQLLVGPVGVGLHLDHLCRNKACVNPRHIEPVTPSENSRRALPFHDGAFGAAKARRAKTHCPAGHPYDDANTLRWGGRRYCRACQNIRNAARKAAA